ncbi:ATP-binding protein [Phenylobacterium sp.]|uniref:ATP-binding protein n=1 Tax=Phenylobacterium sp. TaxID=1871053 RepID=UPI0030F36F07
MFALISCLQQHDPRLVAWAVVICVVAVTASLNAYQRAASTEGGLRAAWLIMVALLLGSGVWATHFLAMLAYHQDMVVRFGLNLTALSYLVAVCGIGAGAAVAAMSDTPKGRALGGALCGASISSMHFIGVSAMRLAADLQWDPVMVVAAIAISVTAAPAALVLAVGGAELGRKAAAVVAMVVAIAGLHFTAMAAVTLVPVDRVVAEGLQGGRDLALVIGALAGLILTAGVAMLISDRVARNLSSLRSALDSAPAAIAAFDADGRLTFWSQRYAAFLKTYGIVARQGLPMGEILSKGRDVARAEKRHRGRAGTQTHELITPDGRCYQGRMQMNRGGGFVVVLTDITEQQELSQREAAARRLAEDASQAKSDFLANMSHEIRTPLNGVLGMAQVMDRGPLEPEQRKRLEVIGEAGQALLVLLNNILDLSKIEAGKLELESYPFDLNDIVTQSAAAHAPLAAQKDLAFRIEIAPGAQGVWNGDGGKLRQVLANLVSNALKFTSQGAIEVLVTPAPEGLTFEVRDTGIGIPADKLKVIFEQFAQADTSTTRRYGGTGLGLTICRELTELMGGELAVESTPGEGSAFRFTLPLAPAATSPATNAAPIPVEAPSQTLRILAAEDNPTNQLILRALLEPLDIELEIVGDGREAVEASAAQAFDLILMDIQMPELNGLEATAEIRQRELARSAPPVPIIALTANVMRHQIDEYLAAGMVGFVAKPINARVLMEAIEAALTPVAEPDARLSA